MGGLAILSRLGTPMLRVTTSPQVDLGRWMHAIAVCLHIINLYGWVDDVHSTRQVILEVCTAELHGHRILTKLHHSRADAARLLVA
eukprot:5730975-Amphidinium_carterae.1